MKKLFSIALILIIAVSIGCIKQMETQPNDTNNIVTAAKVFDDINYNVVASESNVYTYKFTNQTMPDFTPNTFLVHHNWPKTQSLKKIVRVEKIDAVTVKIFTTDAQLEEIVPNTGGQIEINRVAEVCEYVENPDGTININSQMSKANIEALSSSDSIATGAVLNGNLSKDISFNLFSLQTLFQSQYANVKLTGTANVKPSVTVKIETSWAKLTYFEIIGATEVSFKTQLAATATYAFSKTLSVPIVPQVKKVYVFFLGALPVYITLSLDLAATATLNFNGSANASLTLDGAYKYTYGTYWSKSTGWRQSANNGLTTIKAVGFTPAWKISANATAYAGIKGVASILVFDVVGPKITAEPYVVANATLSNTIVNWNLSRGFKSVFRIGVDENQKLIPTSIFGIDLYWQKTLIDYKATMSTGSYNLLNLLK